MEETFGVFGISTTHTHTHTYIYIRGPFQKFCTLYVFSLKMNLFYKIDLQAFNVTITTVQLLGKSCIPVWTPSLLMRLITHVISLDTSSMLLKRFPRSGFFNFGNKSKSGGLSPPDFDLFRRNHSVGNASEALRRCLMR
jgi:hypothetical protein